MIKIGLLTGIDKMYEQYFEQYEEYIERCNPKPNEIEINMTFDEIEKVVAGIVTEVKENGKTKRINPLLFGRFGLNKNEKIDAIYFDNLLKNSKIEIFVDYRKKKSIADCGKNDIIVFKPKMDTNNKKEPRVKKVKVSFAGTIHISNDESNIRLYPHQEEAFFNLQKEIIRTDKNPFAGLLVLPTGGGKTLTVAHWLSKNILDKGKKVLWIAHRHELLEQAKTTFAEKLAFKDIFADKKSFNYRILSGIHDKPIHIKPEDDIVFASKDSVNAGFSHLLKNWIKDNTDEIFLVIDEAHHATAKTYRKIITKLQDNVSKFRMLGLTATPFRTAEKEQGLLKKVFPDDIVYKIDLRTLIRVGILSEPYFEEVQTGQDIIGEYELTDAQIEELQSQFGDFNAILGENIAKTIAENKERNLTIVEKYISQKEKYKQTLVFALNVDNAIALNALFREKGVKSDYVISTVKDAITGVTISSKENKEKISSFRKGELEVLINVNILTEGTDVPNVQSVFLTRPTMSSILMTQMIGRGLRGLKAGGTKEAFIVSFVDNWRNKVAWVNPEKLFIAENIDFDDKDHENIKHLVRLVAISKIEEFAILNNQIIEPEIRAELEKLDFIERIPIGIYQFKFEEKNCEILVYDNGYQSYVDFITDLPAIFGKYKLGKKEYLTENELDSTVNFVENEYFSGCLNFLAYRKEDIKDVLKYYASTELLPIFTEFKEREKYDIDKIAKEIYDADLRRQEREDRLTEIWNEGEHKWQTFFNFDERNFRREIWLAEERIARPPQKTKIPTDEKELRELEKLSLYDLRQVNPVYERWLRNEVFKKFTDKKGYYFSAESGYKSKNKLFFQIDHIKPMHNGGLTVLENLQLLTRAENAVKGIKEKKKSDKYYGIEQQEWVQTNTTTWD